MPFRESGLKQVLARVSFLAFQTLTGTRRSAVRQAARERFLTHAGTTLDLGDVLGRGELGVASTDGCVFLRIGLRFLDRCVFRVKPRLGETPRTGG